MHPWQKLISVLILWVAFCGGIAAQQTLLHSGSSGLVSSGASTNPCSGTTLHVAAPNDFTNAAWANNNENAANAVSDPLGGTNASKVTTNSACGSACAKSTISYGNGNLTQNVTYSASGYFKNLVSPVWINIMLAQGNVNDQMGAWFNASNGTVGSLRNAGNGSAVCANASNQGNGYFFFSIGGSFTTAITGALFNVFPVDGNGTFVATNGQSVAGYQMAP